MGIFSWLWPFGKKKEEVEKPAHMDEYVSRYRRLEEIKQTNTRYYEPTGETATERANRLDKDRREERIAMLSQKRQVSRNIGSSSSSRSAADRGMDMLGGAAIGYAVGSMLNDRGGSSSSYSSSESSYGGGDFSGGGSDGGWDSDGGDCGGGDSGGGD